MPQLQPSSTHTAQAANIRPARAQDAHTPAVAAGAGRRAEPMRGRRNEPAFVVHTAQRLAEVHGVSLERLLFNSFVVAIAIAVGKIIISFLSAFAIVFFSFRGRMLSFWLIFVTLMLPLEVRIVPTYSVAANALGRGRLLAPSSEVALSNAVKVCSSGVATGKVISMDRPSKRKKLSSPEASGWRERYSELSCLRFSTSSRLSLAQGCCSLELRVSVAWQGF